MFNSNAAARVVQELRGLAGAAPAGTRLPSVRELTARHQASPVTVAAAIRQLVAEGLVETRSGRGTFVAARSAAPSSPPDMSWQTVALGPRRFGEEEMQALLALPPSGAIPLTGGYLDAHLQPAAALGAALARAARQPAAWQRGPVEGREDLRSWFARETSAPTPIPSDPGLRAEDMVICSGGQAALSSTLRALTEPGDTLLVESPTYLGALAAAHAAGLRVVPVPADRDGVLPDQLAAAFTRTGARLFYCQPLYANPTGATLSPARRPAVLAALREAGAFLIEDDYARDLTIDGDPPPPLAASDPGGHVIYLRSLTKSAAPGLRVAALGARGPAGARLRAARLLDDFFVAGPLQQATLEFVTSPAWHRHRRTLRTELRTRRDALLTALHRHLPHLVPPTVPAGGLHLWTPLPTGADDVAVATAAATAGVVVLPGRPWHAAEPPGPHLRLTYAAAPPSAMDEAVRRLATVVPVTRP
ncbi:DNA-binding transcriptional regulator, MocR family, contains an aminotransferase domain [Actinoplanes philippinensis]|uniref:DNA-binding transcriptional regulator, MocR family, contains an aminotransferase domain n=1 Tax=Actinoplanes philippinensis TaxID=35752 RepID=A0A1I2HMR0_9ACTN|nr:PLP-dependent aminotransferase family protein [Actinoplanes philippinensis]SFF30992.1 DNA-binding transcriptional regulator, MocR family, contains an aminotransferase domain [Actinoplanes philippinensis]